mmetsp:Transcript_21200/g.27906  ORF Transcript_21200/g.27906 Transcript_21200/m.27906 type:complete len:116 (-) Transcript_21200:179-526(-)
MSSSIKSKLQPSTATGKQDGQQGQRTRSRRRTTSKTIRRRRKRNSSRIPLCSHDDKEVHRRDTQHGRELVRNLQSLSIINVELQREQKELLGTIQILQEVLAVSSQIPAKTQKSH